MYQILSESDEFSEDITKTVEFDPGGTVIIDNRIRLCSGWQWSNHAGHKMVNKVASTFQVDRHLHCMINCTLSPICDSYNYRPYDKTCELNTHDTPLIANSADMVVDNVWGWWSPNFVVVL